MSYFVIPMVVLSLLSAASLLALARLRDPWRYVSLAIPRLAFGVIYTLIALGTLSDADRQIVGRFLLAMLFGVELVNNALLLASRKDRP